MVTAFACAAAESARYAQQLQQQQQAAAQAGPAQAQALAQQFGESLEAAVAAALVWAQGARPAEHEAAPGPEPAGGPEGEGGEGEDPLAAQPIPALLQSLERRLGLARVEEACAHASAALAALAAAADAAPQQAAALAGAAALLGPMLRMLRGALCQLGLQYLAAHKAAAKLGYVCASLFAGLVQEGFCMPEGEPAGRLVPGCLGKRAGVRKMAMQTSPPVLSFCHLLPLLFHWHARS